MDPLQYQCPYCTGTIAVEIDSVGEQVVCPHCQRPVKIDPPSARLLDTHDAESSPSPRSQDAEATVKTVHPAMFRARPFRFLLILLLVVAGAVLLVTPTLLTGLLDNSGGAGTVESGAVRIGGAVLMAIALLWLLIWYVSNLATTLTVTTKRTRLVRGLVSKHSTEVQHDDVRNIQVSTEVQHDDVRNIQVTQSLVQRMIGVGNLAISSSGQDDLEIDVVGIPSPEDIADEIRKRQ